MPEKDPARVRTNYAVFPKIKRRFFSEMTDNFTMEGECIS